MWHIKKTVISHVENTKYQAYGKLWSFNSCTGTQYIVFSTISLEPLAAGTEIEQFFSFLLKHLYSGCFVHYVNMHTSETLGIIGQVERNFR